MARYDCRYRKGAKSWKIPLENPARRRGHLENLLANPNKIAPLKNLPALPWREVGSFTTELHKREGVSARAIEFAILTACCSDEVRGARRYEIDLEAKLWTIPAERMKAGKKHRFRCLPVPWRCLA